MFTSQHHFGIEDGLPQSFVSGITQDKDGFIWISTLDGLSRYDGRSFKNFRNRPGDETSLARNAIYKMFPQANNKVTLIYEGAFYDTFDLRTFQSARSPHLPSLYKIPNAKPLVMNTGNIYNGTDWLFSMKPGKGIGWRNSKTGNTYYANVANRLLKQDTISAFFQTTDGRIFLVSENGVQISNTLKNRFEFIRFQTNVKKLAPALYIENRLYAGSVALLAKNRLLVYQSDTLVMLDLARKTTKKIPIPAARLGVYRELEKLLCLDAKGQAYFINGGSVFRINKEDKPELVWQNTASPHTNITAFFVDSGNVLWLSINAQGITRIDLNAMPFQSYRYEHSFVADVLEKAGVAPSLIPAKWLDPVGAYYFRQARDSKNRLYLCKNPYNDNEIFSYDERSFTKFRHTVKLGIFSALFIKPDDQTSVFDQRTANWYTWKTPESVPDSVQFGKAHMNKTELADAYYLGGSLWLSTYAEGLLQYRGNKRINQFAGKQPGSAGFMPKELTEICVNPLNKNQFWIGSRGGGLILWDMAKGLQKVYTVDDGLPNNTIYCIVPDNIGKIWCSTNKGIFRFDPKTKAINSFEKPDGLQGNEFNRAHKFRFADGRIAFGGTEGYTIFNPADFNQQKQEINVPIQLTNLQINNEPQGHTERNAIISEPLASLTSIELPYDKNYLRFEFAAMLFNQPQKTKYRYRLQGTTNAGWIENGTNNVASYASLPAGSYKLQISATDYNGLWSPDIREIAITIRPPFWATWWAYLAYSLILLLLGRQYFVFRERRILTEQNLAFGKREALRLREMDEMKDRFFSNVTHEFRTPLTLIISPLEKLLTDVSLPQTVIQTLQTVHRNSSQLLHLSNEFLDFSKLNNGQIRLNLSSGELSFFVSDCIKAFETAALAKHIRLIVSVDLIQGYYMLDHEKWRKIVSNLVSNALKFTPVNGVISLSLTPATDDKVRLEVTDNGPGITADQQLKIFDRFYQADDSAIRNYGGTGIGLSLVKELVELMNGSISVDSELGKYSKFTVEMPVLKVVTVQENSLRTTLESTHLPIGDDREKALIMIVEDNLELLSFITSSLDDTYNVISTSNGLTAWELILEELPDIVVSDVMMPGRDGFDLCALCKSDPRTAHIGFILLTSKSAHDARMKGLQAGADDYMTKPFQMAELDLRVSNLFRLQQRVRTQLKARLFSTEPQEQSPVVTDPFLARLYAVIESRLADPGLDVDYLCKVSVMSRSTLNRKLKSLLGMSPNDLIRQYRLQKATGYLDSGLDITSTTFKTGFSSPSYFSQCFREQYGMSPSEYISKAI